MSVRPGEGVRFRRLSGRKVNEPPIKSGALKGTVFKPFRSTAKINAALRFAQKLNLELFLRSAALQVAEKLDAEWF
jgi:hypothetical protein